MRVSLKMREDPRGAVDQRAYSILTVKAVNEDQRIIEGIATTPTPDRLGDIVETDGAEFKLPLPLLWQHDTWSPIGEVLAAKVAPDSISIRAKIATATEPGTLKDRLDEAWQSVKTGLVKGLSIGFRAIETARIEGTYSYRFTKWEWLELSAVTIPANAEASIQLVRSLCRGSAAPGERKPPTARSQPAPRQPATPSQEKPMAVKTISEQIAALEARRAANAARMEAIAQKSIDDDRTMDETEHEEFDTVDRENEAIDASLVRLRKMEKTLATRSRPIVDPTGGQPARGGGTGDVTHDFTSVSVKQAPKPEPGIRMARYMRCVGLAHNTRSDVLRVAEHLYGERDPDVVAMVKAAGTAIGALNSSTDSALLDLGGGFADFVDFLRARTILGRFGANGIPALRRVPFRIPLKSQSTGSTAYWVGEGDGKPVTKPSFGSTSLTPLKVAAISVATMELLRDSSPSAEVLLRDDLTAAVAERLDLSFADPTVAAVVGVSPASITYGAESIVAQTTGDADDIRTDVRAVMQKFIDAKNPLTNGVWIMSSANALALAIMKNSLGQAEFPGMTINGGTFMGLPSIVSDYVGDYVVLVNASDVWFGDDGGIAIDMSTEASLQMVAGDDDGSTQNAITPTATSVMSLWQTNSVGFRAERTVNWALRRASAVAYLTSVEWGGHVPPS